MGTARTGAGLGPVVISTVAATVFAASPVAVSSPAPTLASRGYVLEWRRQVGYTGRFLVDGAEVSRTACRDAPTECREVVAVAFLVHKVEPDPFDSDLPQVCATAQVAGEVQVVGRNRWCDELRLGGKAAHVVELAVPLSEGRQAVQVSLRLERVAASGEAMQSLGVAEGSWVLGASFRRWLADASGIAAPSSGELVAGGVAVLALALLAWWLVRRTARRRAALAEELARLNQEISAASAVAPAVEVASEVGAERSEGGEAAVEPRRGGRLVPASIEVDVTPDEVQPGGRSVARLDVRVMTSGGGPAAGVRVRMVADGGPVDRILADRTAVTDPDGHASLEVSVPLMAEVRRLYFSVEASSGTEEPGSLRERTWIRVRDIALEVKPARPRIQRGADGGFPLLALLRDDAGQPVAGVELRSEVVDAGGGWLTPETAVTDAAGRAEFLYGAGQRAGEIRVRIWPEGEPRLAREVVVEQVE